MSKERELLELAYQYIPLSSVTSQEIRAYLAEPEVKREPLSDEDIDRELIRNDYYSRSFTAGVRFAEKHHGIGGGDE